MALTAVKRPLSGGTGYLPITVSSTAGGNTVIHAANQSSTAVLDTLYLNALNTASDAITLWLEVGGSANRFKEDVPGNTSEHPILNGYDMLNQSAGNTATTMYAFASSSGTLKIWGHVVRTTES